MVSGEGADQGARDAPEIGASVHSAISSGVAAALKQERRRAGRSSAELRRRGDLGKMTTKTWQNTITAAKASTRAVSATNTLVADDWPTTQRKESARHARAWPARLGWLGLERPCRIRATVNTACDAASTTKTFRAQRASEWEAYTLQSRNGPGQIISSSKEPAMRAAACLIHSAYATRSTRTNAAAADSLRRRKVTCSGAPAVPTNSRPTTAHRHSSRGAALPSALKSDQRRRCALLRSDHADRTDACSDKEDGGMSLALDNSAAAASRRAPTHPQQRAGWRRSCKPTRASAFPPLTLLSHATTDVQRRRRWRRRSHAVVADVCGQRRCRHCSAALPAHQSSLTTNQGLLACSPDRTSSSRSSGGGTRQQLYCHC